MLRGKRNRIECKYGCCREYRTKRDTTYRTREKRQWKKEA